MAAPADSARTTTSITTAGTSHAINVGSPAAGRLLVVFIRFAGAPGTVTFTGYTSLNGAGGDTSDASDDATMVFVRKADGAEGVSDTLTTGNSIKLCAVAYNISGAEDPTVNAPVLSTVAVGTTTANTANPTSAAPLGAPQDTLYLALAACDGEVGAFTAAPTNYTNLAATNSGTGGAATTNVLMGTASRQISASSSDDPGAFTHGAASTGWTAYTLAIRAPQPAVLNAVPGSYAVAGSTTPVVAGRAIDAALGTYAVAGSAATIPAGRAINAALGTYAVAGSVASLPGDRLLNAALGTYAVAGSDVQASRGFSVNLVPGSYAIAGADASVVAGRLLNAGVGAYTVTGDLAALVAGRALDVSPGSFAITGDLAALLADRTIDAGIGVYDVAGDAASLLAGRILVASPGAYAVSGELAALLADRVLGADVGVYLVAGVDVALIVTPAPGAGEFVIVAQPGTYALVGLDSDVVADRLLEALPAGYVVLGVEARLSRTGAGVTILPETRAPILAKPGVAGFARPSGGRILEPDSGELEVEP